MMPRCYRKADLLQLLQMSERTFERLRRDGRLPFLDELRPRLGRVIRYRCEPVDRYLANQATAPRAFALARRR